MAGSSSARYPPRSRTTTSKENTVKFMCLTYEEEEKLNELSPSEWAALRDETIAYV